MKLWLLTPIDENYPAWDPWYDKCFGFVIRAETEPDARNFASARHGDEGGEAWLDREQSDCRELTTIGASGIVLMDSRWA